MSKNDFMITAVVSLNSISAIPVQPDCGCNKKAKRTDQTYKGINLNNVSESDEALMREQYDTLL